MMASANIELVRAAFAAWGRGDFSSVDWASADVEFVVSDGPEPGSWIGVAGMSDGFRDFLSTWEAYRIEAEEYRELDDERVLVFFRRRGRAKRSGLEIAQFQAEAAVLFHLRDGKVTRLVTYSDPRAVADLR